MSKETRTLLIQALLFVATFISTTLAGAEWTYGKSVYGDFTWQDFASGLSFSVPFLLILTVHEFGHYFTARHNRVPTSLPYYIPLPPIPLSIGTMGAIIRLRARVTNMRQHFDIGIAGPLAGFVMAVAVLWYGFATLPPPEYIFEIHPEYETYGLKYADNVYDTQEGIIDVVIGKSLLFWIMEKTIADPERMPNVHEVMHYPYLFAGFLALVFTSLNLLPIGQLDGGHVLYGLVGYARHKRMATIIFLVFMFYAGLGLVHPGLPKDDLLFYIPAYGVFLFLCFKSLGLPQRDTVMYVVVMFALQFLAAWLWPGIKGYSGWLVFGFVLGRFIGIHHPPAEVEQPLDRQRQWLGWLALVIFVLCFSPNPIELIEK
jgi:membrane-associated protease RseP (regulator of RpoE activity)